MRKQPKCPWMVYIEWNIIQPEKGRKLTHATTQINLEGSMLSRQVTKRKILYDSTHEIPSLFQLRDRYYNNGERIMGSCLMSSEF